MTMLQPTEASADALLGEDATLVLSPHMDDALLSAFAVVTAGDVDVWTVFTDAPVPAQTTSWDRACGFQDSDETIAARRAEDEAAFEGTGARNRHIGCLEGAYVDPERRAADAAFIRQELQTWATGHPTGTLIIPACAGIHVPEAPWAKPLAAVKSLRGQRASSSTSSVSVAPAPPTAGEQSGRDSLGSPSSANNPAKPILKGIAGRAKSLAQKALHAEAQARRKRAMGTDGLAANPDHVLVRDIALEVAATDPGLRVVFYEDLPYLWHAKGDDEMARTEARSGVRTTKCTVAIDAAAKFHRLQRYTSQMPVMDKAGRLSTPGHLPPVENYWELSK